MRNINAAAENKNVVVSLILVVAIIVVIVGFFSDNKFLGGYSSNDNNSAVEAGDVIITDSTDIESIDSDKLNDSSSSNGSSSSGGSVNSGDSSGSGGSSGTIEPDLNGEVIVDSNNITNGVINKDVVLNVFIAGDFLSDGVVNDKEKVAMDSNTKLLQKLVDNAKKGQVIKLPSGVFYFSAGGINKRRTENYVIMLNDNVNMVGAGVDENTPGKYTILKPYAPSGTIQNGLDMFYFNELRDSDGANPDYLENVSFSDFIIDGEDVRGKTYNTSGKGFMINLCRNCSWDNMVVRNTDATGFGMDNVINGSITNSVAINCGKNANEKALGASGFGVGTGYSNEESMYIENCRSIGNAKFGFFFEHQNRFNTNDYKATKAEGFVVVNSYASGNLYNFGGERANDVVYINCTSKKDTTLSDGTKVGYTVSDVYFSDQSRRVDVINLKTDNYFNDVMDSNRYYFSSVNWALKNGLVTGISSDSFGVGKTITRAQAITLLWRMAGRPGNVLTSADLSKDSKKVTNIKTPFKDVSGDNDYVNAIKWALDTNITNGTGNSNFNPDSNITRADFVTMLWRHAGSPMVNVKLPFDDVKQPSYYSDAVKWAYKNNIVTGVNNVKFAPSDTCTREQVITFLHRYQTSSNSRFSIRYLLFGGTAVNNTSYLAGADNFKIANPTKKGYTFVGWTGSNGDVPSKNVNISKSDVGNKVFVANYVAN